MNRVSIFIYRSASASVFIVIFIPSPRSDRQKALYFRALEKELELFRKEVEKEDTVRKRGWFADSLFSAAESPSEPPERISSSN